MGSENVDRLSSMPDEVISHILSLMPTEFAVRTCVLSKSWIHTWKSVTNLVFGDDQHPFYDLDRLITFVDWALKCCKPSQVQLFRLHRSWIHESFVCEWIDAAVRLNVCELDIKVRHLVLPHSFFTCKTLTKLSLHSCDELKYNPSYYNVINLPCLKTINIEIIKDEAFVNALRIIRGSPELVRLLLKIHNSSNKEYNFNIPSLKHMDLSIKKCQNHSYKVVLNVPKLEDLIVKTNMSTVFVMEDLLSLNSVTLSYHIGCYRLSSVEIFKGISGAKSLTLDVNALPNTSSDITIPNFRSSLKRLVFRGLDWPLFHQILENSPELEHLCITMVF